MVEPPTEYKDAYNALIAFRKKVFAENVGGRVKALLDASHETLKKYGDLIDGLSVVPYMFGNVRQKALALKLSGRDVGSGEIAQAKASFVLDKAVYPLDFPYSVPQRRLPQVDVFRYTAPSDMTVIEKTTEEVWANLFVLQAESKKFKEVADAENVLYDYYKFRPVGRCKTIVNLSEPQAGFDSWNKLDGEATILVRSVTPQTDSVIVDYDMCVLVDCNYLSTTNEIGVVPLVLIVTSETALLPEVILVGGGKHIKNIDKGVYSGWLVEGQFSGWTKTHNAYEMVTKEVLWSSASKFILEVNDISMGTLDKPLGESVKKAVEATLVTASPYTGYNVKNWELDGTQFPTSLTFNVKHYRDHTLVCVFVSGGTLIMRPTANGDVIQLLAYGDSPNWKCVDEEVSDGDATLVHHYMYDARRYDLYQLSDPSIPSGNVIDNVTVFARVRSKNPIATRPANIVIKTNGVVVYDVDYYPPWGWTLISKKWIVNPVTGSAWTIAEVNALQAGVRLYYKQIVPLEPYDGLCTQVWAEVTHHAP